MRIVLAFCVVWLLATTCAADRPRWTMLIDVDGRQIEGTPLAWSDQQVFLLARDGRLWDFSPRDGSNPRKVNAVFSSFSASEVRAQLERELRGSLVVTGTGHYLVAHPPGKEAWAQRFEDLYRSCIHYFGLREMRVHEPTFPLVALVWGSHQDFIQYSLREGSEVNEGVLGYYSPKTNRVTLYDQGGPTRGRGFLPNETTIIHEATHQMAFNTGVHNRFSPTPLWLAEGLGTMFEATGVWNWREHPNRRERVNQSRLAQFRAWQAHGRAKGDFAQLLTSDRLFATNPSAAYSEAWAWVFFLTETHPQKFAEYVRRVAARKDFQAYPPQQRIADFSSVFGNDLRMLEKHCLNFIRELN